MVIIWTDIRINNDLTHWSRDKMAAKIKILLKFVPKGPINNILGLVEIIAWC